MAETTQPRSESHEATRTTPAEETAMPARSTATLVAALGLTALLSGCGDAAARPSTSSPPAEVAKACGHPGTVVELTRVPLVVRRASCDLTGVVVRYRGVGVTVPSSGGISGVADGVGSSAQLTANVAAGSGDVTIDD